MRRSLTDILKQESPVSLAREALWRGRRKWYRKRALERIEERPCPVKLREVCYYASDIPSLRETSHVLISAYADEICNGNFPFMGYGTWVLGREPKWNCDFVAGLDWPEIGFSDHSGVRLDGSDIKVPYELSRLQFLPVLGKAHMLTGNQSYRDRAKYLLSDWIEKNPVGIGVNWSIAMEAALRAMSICFLLSLMAPLRSDEESWLLTVTRCLWHHMLYIEGYIEFSHLMSSNHYLSNVVGLYCLSEYLDGPGMAAKRRLYRQTIESEMSRQVYEDGGDYEASTGYHVLVTQMFTSALLLMRASDVTPDPSFWQRLSRMYQMMNELASPTDQLPHIGDCDDGRVELLLDDLQQMLRLPVAERNSLRISNLLGLGKCLFNGGPGSTEDAKWYGFKESVTSSPPSNSFVASPKVAVFPHSGIAIARSEEVEILFCAIPNGIFGKGSHTHNDKLSFVLRLDGDEVLCDSGTGTYTRDLELRNRLRATAAHNSVVVDGQEQNTIDNSKRGLFWIGNEAEVSGIEQWKENEDLLFRASHKGYQRLGVMHTRTIRLAGKKQMAIVDDQLEGTGEHRVEINFQLNSKWTPSSLTDQGSKIEAKISGPRDLQITFRGSEKVHAEREISRISMSYGALTPSSSLRFCGEVSLPAMLTTTFCWSRIASEMR